MFQKLFRFYFSILQSAFERKSINFIMKRENDHPSVLVAHLNVTAFPMNLDKTEPFKCLYDLAP